MNTKEKKFLNNFELMIKVRLFFILFLNIKENKLPIFEKEGSIEKFCNSQTTQTLPTIQENATLNVTINN